MLHTDSFDFDFERFNKDVNYLFYKYRDVIYKLCDYRDDYDTYENLSKKLDNVVDTLLYINSRLEEKSFSINTFKGGYNK